MRGPWPRRRALVRRRGKPAHDGGGLLRAPAALHTVRPQGFLRDMTTSTVTDRKVRAFGSTIAKVHRCLKFSDGLTDFLRIGVGRVVKSELLQPRLQLLFGRHGHWRLSKTA